MFEKPYSNNIIHQLEVIQHHPKMVEAEDNVRIGRPTTLKEIKDTLNAFAKDKSPGPNGWTTELFIDFVDLVGEDILKFLSYLVSQVLW